MPSVLTYPGVYIEEIPSGVRTITGVGTSITAFVGYTARGPLNRAVRIFNFGDFERSFGGLHRDSDVSYAVQQFFQNGGSDAHVVRVAAGAASASVQMRWGAGAGDVALAASAVDAGAWGNRIRLDVDYATANPDSTFNLTVTRVDPATLAVAEREEFRNLSMNPRSGSYAPSVVNASSRLVRLAPGPGLAFAADDRGWSLSTEASAVNLTGPANATRTRIAGVVDGDTPFELTINPGAITSVATARTQINTAISNAGLAGRLEVARANADGSLNTSSGTYLRIRSVEGSGSPEHSSVTIVPAAVNDASAALGLGLAAGGREREGASFRRPVPTGTTSADLAGAMGTSVGGDVTVTLVDHPQSGDVTLLAATTATLAATPVGTALRDALQTLIRGLAHPAAQGATVQLSGSFLRVTLPDAYPHASILLSGTPAALGNLFAAAGSPQVNVQRYSPGIGASFGAQANAVLGADGTPPGGTEYLGSFDAKTGIYALRDVDLFNLLCIPGTARLPEAEATSVIQAAIALCVAERAFFLADPPPGETLTSVDDWAAGVTTSRNAAVYFPRIVAADPLDGFRLRDMPASGAVAGVYARTDAERGVWKAPAGTEAVLRGTQGLAQSLTDLENGTLNPLGVNCLRTFPVYGRVVWGARTRAGADASADEYKYVPVRRLALYLEESLYRGTQWVVFEPNDEPLWAQIRLNVGAFMNNLFRQGAFQGKTPAEAYLVKCDRETTTQNEIDLGIVNILVAFAPLKPAEFVVIRIQQKAGQVAA